MRSFILVLALAFATLHVTWLGAEGLKVDAALAVGDGEGRRSGADCFVGNDYQCHLHATCRDGTSCECMPGTLDNSGGDGTDCVERGYAVRYVYNSPVIVDEGGSPVFSNDPMGELANSDILLPPGAIGPSYLCSSNAAGWHLRYLDDPPLFAGVSPRNVEVYCLFLEKGDAEADFNTGVYGDPDCQPSFPPPPCMASLLPSPLPIIGIAKTVGPAVYRWTTPSSDNEISVPPSGLEVSSVSFVPVCAASGCWVITGTLSAGQSAKDTTAFNTLFLPHADIAGDSGDGDIASDFDYSSGGNSGEAVEWTFQPANHPCTSVNFDSTSNTQAVVSCCITNDDVGESGPSGSKGGFLANYRAVESFVTWVGLNMETCYGTTGAEMMESPGADQSGATVPFPTSPYSFLLGKFDGMPVSPGIVSLDVTDPFFGQADFEIHLDEVELRARAGKLRGTVGVEHSVDTFLGFANFRTTGVLALDTFVTQAAIRLEKTSFFTVSTRGTNEYTFLEYVNLRLVTILLEDSEFFGSDESADRTVRTARDDNVNYLQVTFTVGAKYTINDPNEDKYTSGLIPLDSVRAGRGGFIGSTTMEEVCSEYESAGDGADVGLTVGRVTKSVFDGRLEQSCAPAATMCASPAALVDQFVSFNVPLGKEILDSQDSSSLANNIFVDMVINALDPTGGASPNSGDDPLQMKTTLSASIPIVEAGDNIFCDGVTAKTDLKDVANADIIVGSAQDANELTRLRIVGNVTSSDLNAAPRATINTASIEAALMTLVVRGQDAYFSTGASNTGGYSLELDDLITIHLMEDGTAGQVTGGVSTIALETELLRLLAQPADDNSDADGLVTEGYKLNGAFKFEVDRADGIAKLEPTDELLTACPFNPPRPVDGNWQMESCITRRDVWKRQYPARPGASPTAMEIFNAKVMEGGFVNTWDEAEEAAALESQVSSVSADPCPEATYSGVGAASWEDEGYGCEAGFLTRILGDSVYARSLAKNYVTAIRSRYALNGRYIRAYWINPGYEWTPTQTGGRALFTVSQKVYLFALVTLDENWDLFVQPRRRRMLLSTDPTEGTGSGSGAARMEFAVSPKSIMASTFEVPEDKVAMFSVELQLTMAEACASKAEQQEAVRATLEDYLERAASRFHTVQVTSMVIDRGDEVCDGGGRRRSIRRQLSGFSSASARVQMMVVFTDEGDAKFSEEAFLAMPGVASVLPDPANSKEVQLDSDLDCSRSGCGVIDLDEEADDESSSSMTGIIIGVAVGVGGALAVLGVLFMVLKRRSKDADDDDGGFTTVQPIQLEDLKAQLAQDL